MTGDRLPTTKSSAVPCFVAEFPQRYHVHALYGESMGAAVFRRLRIVEDQRATR